MYDGISPLRLPAGAQLYAGYDDGRWPDASAIAARFPGKRVLRITTDPADAIGDVLDVERGDATPADIPAWLRARRVAGAWPSVYCSLSSWTACGHEVSSAGMWPPPWWVADYSLTPTRKPASAVALQYQSTPGYDVSVVDDYWPGVDPAPSPTVQTIRPSQEDLMQLNLLPDGRGVVVGHSPQDHLLVFTSVGPFDGSPTQQWSVQDVTDQIGPAGQLPTYTVAG